MFVSDNVQDAIYNNGSIITSGQGAYGVVVNQSARAYFNNTQIITSGQNAHALVIASPTAREVVTYNDGSITANGNNSAGVALLQQARATLGGVDVTVSGNGSIGLWATADSEILFNNATITAGGTNSYGVLADDDSKITITNTDIEINGNGNFGAVSASDSEIILNNVHITTQGNTADGLFVIGNNRQAITMNGGSITANDINSAAVVLQENGTITLNSVAAVSKLYNGAQFGEANGADSLHGNVLNLVGGASLLAETGNAIEVESGNSNIFNVSNGGVEGRDRLVNVLDYAGSGAGQTQLTFNADNSNLIGGAMVGNDASLHMSLNNNTLWDVKRSATGSGQSRISTLELDNATIRFNVPTGNPLDLASYQSLLVGAGLPGTFDVYNATGANVIELNSYLNDGGGVSNQFTDRLLIAGNVNGSTTLLKIKEMAGSPGGLTSPGETNLNSEGISLVQVSGAAAENSFALSGTFVTMANQPFAYSLYAYGPGSKNGAADPSQIDPKLAALGVRLLWDYRLQNVAFGSGGIGPQKDDPPQVVPQVANYLTAPNALFEAGRLNIGTLHLRLGELRHTADSTIYEEQQNLFLRGYGGDYTYHSNLSPTQYGYNADIRHSALQFGGNIYEWEGEESIWLFGVAGSYGKLSFDPYHDLKADKTNLDVLTGNLYASYLHNNGTHLDMVLSYGGFKGQVSSPYRGLVSRLAGNMWAASVEVGRAYKLDNFGWQDWSIEPQAQIVYQGLDMKPIHDADDFPVEYGTPEQWLGRFGFQLRKDIPTEKLNRAIVYGNFNYLESFGNKGKDVWMGEKFQTGEYGRHIETGLGLSVDFNKNSSLYGEASWKERVSSGGSRGLNFNIGTRVEF